MYCKGINPLKVLTFDFSLFWELYPVTIYHILFQKITGRKLRSHYFGGRRVVTQCCANNLIKEKIYSNQPFMFGRNGTNEDLISGTGYLIKNKILNTMDDGVGLKTAFEHCGLFPYEDEVAEIFSALIYDATSSSDIYGTLYAIMGSYDIRKNLHETSVLTSANTMDFWRFDEPFTYALRGKKVLVVHPLAELIEDQYKKREFLFENPKVLPEFELLTVKAVQTIAGELDPRFETWFDALAFMKEEIARIDFDIALLGCGAYGMPLAAEVKKMGKQSVYMGGVLQILFGIKGGRWDIHPEASRLYNEYWVRPGVQDKPARLSTVEDGCYW